MVRKFVKAISIIFIVLILLSACNTTTSAIDSKVRAALSSSSRSDEAVQWLITNGDIVVPELVNRISNSGNNKSVQAAEALIAMGDYGRQGMIKRFDTMTLDGRDRICNALAQQGDKQAVLELLELSQHQEAFDISVKAIVSMGDIALNYLSGQLHTSYYQAAVDSSLISFGEKAVDKVLQAVHSTNEQKVARALSILTVMGESAVKDLAYDALNISENIDEAKNIANIMLKNYPESSITALMSGITDTTRVSIAATLLYEVAGDDKIDLVLMQSELGDTATTAQVLQEFAHLCGADRIMQFALEGDDEVSAGVKVALGNGQYDEDTFTAILNNLTPNDNSASKLFSLSNELIIDENLKLLAQSVIARDANAYAQAAANGMETAHMGEMLSKSAHNEEVPLRLYDISNVLEGDFRKQIYMVFGCASDDKLPALVLAEYAAGAENALLAGKALTQTPVANGKYLFQTDMMPYVGKIIEGLVSNDDTLRSNAQIILSRVSTDKSQNDFYKTVFAYYKDRAIFSVIASHYIGAGALPVELSLENNGQTIEPTTISIEFTGDIKNVPRSNEPDYTTLLTGFASFLNLEIVEEGADVSLTFDCNVTPRSKRYPGLLSNSYLGAEAWGNLKASVDGSQVATSEGYSQIAVPDEYPGPSGEFRYKSDEEDAPSDEAYIICFINAMYNMWGDQALFGLYNYNITATSQAAEGLFS